MPIHMLVTVYSVEGIGWKPGFRVCRPLKFYLEVVTGSQPPVTSKKVEIVDDVCAWKEKLPLVITSLDDTLQFRLRRHARVRKDPIFGTLDISAKELIVQSSGDSQDVDVGIQKALQREKGKARPDVPFVIQLSAQETDADGNAKIALDNAVMDVTDNNVGSASGAVDKIETDPALLLVDHLSTLSDKLGVMDVITDKIDSLAELHPYAKIAWTVCSSLYQAVKKQRLTDSNLVSLVKTMSDTYSKVDELKNLPDKIKTLEAAITLILQQISECSLFVREYVYRSFAGRTFEQLWKDQSARVSQYIEAFEQLRNNFDSGVLHQSALIVTKVQADVEKLLKSEQLKSLDPVDMDLSQKKLCLPGTRKKVLAEIISWILQPAAEDTGSGQQENVLWLQGMAGTGKSTIATTIADHFAQLKRRGAYLFFERSTSNPAATIRTLAHQLAKFDSTLCTHICSAISAEPNIPKESLKKQFDALLWRPLSKSAEALTGPIVIVLDALDECGNASSREHLLDVLVDGFHKLPATFRLIITSRAEKDILTRFSAHPSIKDLQLVVGEDDATEDVRAYIKSEMVKIRSFHSLPSEWPKTNEVDTLVEKSGGLFIWVSTASKLLLSEANPRVQLNNLLSSEKGEGLDSLYATALESSCEWQKEESWVEFRSIMTVVLFSRKHFDEHQINHFLGRTEENSCRQILSRLGCLLDLSPGQPIRPLHASFRDYLTDASRSMGKRWSLTSIDPEHFLAECCLRVMSNQLHFNMFGIKTSSKSDRQYFRHNVKPKISPELFYACENWWEHLKSLQTLEQPDPLAKALSDFGSGQFLFWVEVVIVMRVNGLGNSCKIAAECTKKSDPDQATLWKDAQRFVDMYYQSYWLGRFTMEWATPHIYLSALPFTPPTSNISQIYLPKFPNTLKAIFQQTNPPPDHTPSTGDLSHLGFSPDGTMLISCFGEDEEGAVHIRSTQDYSLLPQYQACHHPDGIRVAKFSHDNHFLYCLTLKGALVSWESATGEFTEIHPTGVSDFDIYFEKIIACCEDGNLRIWAKEESGFTGPDIIHVADESLESITVSPNGLVAVSQEKSVHIVDIASQHILRTNAVESSYRAHTLSFTDAGDFLAMVVLSMNSQIYLFSQHNDWRATVQRKKQKNGTYGRTVVWLKERPIVCIGWNDGTASLWNVETQSIISGPLYHSGRYCKVAISPDGKTLATGTAEECIKIWDVEMLLGQGESGTGDPFQILKAENPQLFDGCKYEDRWIIGPGGERLLWAPELPPQQRGLKYTTLIDRKFDFSRFVHGEEWAKCYSG